MRKGELMGLWWSDIDLIEKYFDINFICGDYGENKLKIKISICKVYFDNLLFILIKKYKNYEKECFFKEGIILKDKDYFILSFRNLFIK